MLRCEKPDFRLLFSLFLLTLNQFASFFYFFLQCGSNHDMILATLSPCHDEQLRENAVESNGCPPPPNVCYSSIGMYRMRHRQLRLPHSYICDYHKTAV